MAEHPNVELARRGYEAFSTGDMATLTELIAEHAVWHIGGRNDISGDYKGREQIFGLFGEIAQRTEGTFQLTVHDIIANDEHTVTLTHLTAGGSSGKSVSTNTVDTAHIKNGQLVEFWSFVEDPYALDEYFS